MAGRGLEDGRDLTLQRAAAHEGRIAPASDGKRQSIKKDGFARPGLAGQHRQPVAKL